ncbi:MAG TPA: MepB family protein [Pelobium sp.]|nr:MepB family protein [Pelobium sp.]
MTDDYPVALKKLSKLLFKDFKLSDFTRHQESKEYSACRFRLKGKSVEFRLSKVTPKKVGAFVTIWKRNHAGITQPFDESDELDFIIIVSEYENQFGAFIFPKSVLLEKKIMSVAGIGGKRGLRVYPSWDFADNPQSKKTQLWQNKYFVELHDTEPKNQLIEKLFGIS